MQRIEIIHHFVIFCSTRIPPTGNMRIFYLFCICIFNFLSTIHAEGKSGCLLKEKALALLETAEGFLTKARDSYPSCIKELNSTDPVECGSEKSLAYIEISKKLISDVRENFPSCSKNIIVQDYKPRDCSEILASGNKANGVYTIWPREPSTTEKPLKVYCDMKTDNGGWTVIQRRGKFPVQEDFYRDWESYKNGFGNITQEFWLGNENIRILCHEECEIRFDLQDKNGDKSFATYQSFSLSTHNYRIHIKNYTGNAGDAMFFHHYYDFSTKDEGEVEYAKKYQGGWWYGSFYRCNLNGVYQPGKSSEQSVNWYHFRENENLASVEIKVRPK